MGMANLAAQSRAALLAEDALALPPLAIDLDSGTKRALRLLNKRIKLSVDHSTIALSLSVAAMADTNLVGGCALLRGLRRFESTWIRPQGIPPGTKQPLLSLWMFHSALLILSSMKTLEALELRWPATARGVNAALGTLGTTCFPRLARFSGPAVPGVFTLIPPASMPNLLSLELGGSLSPADLNALATAPFISTLRSLRLPCLQDDNEERPEEVCSALRSLALAATSIERLTLAGALQVILDIFAGAPLSNLAHLAVDALCNCSNCALCLGPLLGLRRPSLQYLTITGAFVPSETLELLVCEEGGILSLPELRSLVFQRVYFPDVTSFCELRFPRLSQLTFSELAISEDDFAFLAAVAAGVPCLKSLTLVPEEFYKKINDVADDGEEGEEEDGVVLFEGYDALESLFHEAQYDALSELTLGGGFDFEDDDEMKLLVERGAVQMPRLRRLVLENATLTAAGLDTLLWAGVQGRWPQLQELGVRALDVRDSRGRNIAPDVGLVLGSLWPGIKLSVAPAR